MVKELNERIHTESKDLPASFLPSKTLNFVGREKFMNEIRSALESGKIVIISSFAGTGKSTLANEYAYRFLIPNNNLVYWFKSDENNLNNEFINFAEKYLNILLRDPEQKNDRNIIINKINTRIRSAKNEKVVFVFDDCENYENIKDYLQMTDVLNNLKIIITTKDYNLIQNDSKHQVNLEPFEEDESIDFLMKYFSLKDRTIAKYIIDFLDVSQDSIKIRPIVLNKLAALINLSKGKLQKLSQLIQDMKNNGKK
jgi:hypothetical protein